MHDKGGMATRLSREHVLRVSSSRALSQSATLAVFANELEDGKLRALRIVGPDVRLEGSWWLCLIIGAGHASD